MRRSTATALVGLLAVGCKEKPHPPGPSSAPSALGSTQSPTSSAPAASTGSPSPSAEHDEDASATDAGGALLELSDVGPASPAAASERGVVMVTKDDRIALAPLGKKGRVEAVKEPKDSFALARGPSVAGEFAYWVSAGRLVRRKIGGGAIEELAGRARSGTRVTALDKNEHHPAMAVYVGAPVSKDANGAAWLWVEGNEPVTLTPEGSAASSVSMVESEDDVVVLSLEGRTGMTPVHARTVTFDANRPKLDEDVVVWVAGPAQSLTEITAARNESDVLGLIPLERDITRFGLAEVRVGSTPKMGAPVVWRAYPNGLDPAPVAVSAGCSKTWVVYARPAETRPGSPQELHLARAEANGLGPSHVVARASAFANVSASPLAQGLLIAYVADFRTWARTFDCRANSP